MYATILACRVLWPFESEQRNRRHVVPMVGDALYEMVSVWIPILSGL